MNTKGRGSLLFGLVLFVAASAVVGCTLYKGESCQEPQPLCSPAPKCDDENDCGVNAWCVNGQCEHAYCTTNADCQKYKEGLMCDVERETCYDPSDGDAETEAEAAE